MSMVVVGSMIKNNKHINRDDGIYQLSHIRDMLLTNVKSWKSVLTVGWLIGV